MDNFLIIFPKNLPLNSHRVAIFGFIKGRDRNKL